MYVFVTGASGFLGKHLCSYLENGEHTVVKTDSKNCDLTFDDSLSKLEHHKYDIIYHLAAWTQAGDFCLHHPGEQWIINQKINTNILEWWHSDQPQAKLVCIGTSCSYSPEYALVEENYLLGLPIDSLFTYGMTKRMLYVGLLALNKQFGQRFLCVVPSTLYGPGYHTDGRQMHFIFDLIRKIVRGKLFTEPVTLWGDGYQSREIIHVDDFVGIMADLAETVDNEIVNIGAGAEATIRYFAEMICEKVGYDFHSIQFDRNRYVGAKSKCLLTGKLNNLLPGLVLKPLAQGLSATIDWVIENELKQSGRHLTGSI